MHIGVIGLGRMSGNIVRRLMRAGHSCVVYDANVAAVPELGIEGATSASSVPQLVGRLSLTRAVRGGRPPP